MSKGWSVFEYHDSVHVMPIDDDEDHYFFDCKCSPSYKEGVYIHNSFDKRELLESDELDGAC